MRLDPSQVHADGSPKPPTVVLALHGRGRPASALRRAVHLAREMGAELHVLRVLPTSLRGEGPVRATSVLEAVHAADLALHVLRATRTWVRDAAPGFRAPARVVVAHGEFAPETAGYAAAVEARYIVVPACAPREVDTGTPLEAAATPTSADIAAPRAA